MKYIIYSPPHDLTVPGFTRQDGTVVPERTFHCGARAVYRHRRLEGRRYVREMPEFDTEYVLVKCSTLSAAAQELKNTRRRWNGFEIREFDEGRVGRAVVADAD